MAGGSDPLKCATAFSGSLKTALNNLSCGLWVMLLFFARGPRGVNAPVGTLVGWPRSALAFLQVFGKKYPQWNLEILLGCRAGFRASEVAGLFVEVCDLDHGLVRVMRTVVGGEDDWRPGPTDDRVKW